MIQIKLKSGVLMENGGWYVHPVMGFVLPIVASVYEMNGARECVVTSVLDGQHSRKSKHYEGKAIDLRIWEFDMDTAQEVVGELQEALNGYRGNSRGEFDVVLERDHIHLEYDPR